MLTLMTHTMWYLRDRLCYLRNQRGLETMEYVLIGGMITAVALVVYGIGMSTGLQEAVNSIVNTIKTKASN